MYFEPFWTLKLLHFLIRIFKAWKSFWVLLKYPLKRLKLTELEFNSKVDNKAAKHSGYYKYTKHSGYYKYTLSEFQVVAKDTGR